MPGGPATWTEVHVERPHVDMVHHARRTIVPLADVHWGGASSFGHAKWTCLALCHAKCTIIVFFQFVFTLDVHEVAVFSIPNAKCTLGVRLPCQMYHKSGITIHIHDCIFYQHSYLAW